LRVRGDVRPSVKRISPPVSSMPVLKSLGCIVLAGHLSLLVPRLLRRHCLAALMARLSSNTAL